ncbi:MAG: D-alanyl-D-alanine carboxypeptidase family protein [Halanaerobiales bacterium]
MFSGSFRSYKKILVCLIVITISFFRVIPATGEEPEFDLNSKSAVLMEYETGEVLFEKDPHLELPPASMTKIMTMLLVMEALNEGRGSLEDKLVVSEKAASMGGSQIWLEPGEEMTLKDMMKAIAIVSANDACVAVAEYFYGTEELFVDRMNVRARELGLKNTYFYNTNGLPPDDSDVQGNYTSAYDLAVMTRELLKYPKVLEWTSTWIDYLRDGESVLNNTNRLIRFYRGADGLKTGYTDEAKYCLTCTASREGIRFISVVMGADDSEMRFNEAAKLLSHGFGLFDSFRVAAANELIEEVKIINGKEEMARGIMREELIVPVKRGEEEEINKEIKLNDRIRAPLKMGDKIGEIKVYKGNYLLKTADIVIDRDVEKASFFRMVLRIIKQLISSILGIFR